MKRTLKKSNKVKSSHRSSNFEAQRKFLTLRLLLSTSQKFLNLILKWVRYGVFGVREFNVQ